jgi:hypothetical protein
MDSTIQPILCCIGDAAAVKPTQFLMERAMTAVQCDWRVITVVIQPEDLATAIQGLQVMKFAALRFFPCFQELVAPLLSTEPLADIPPVTSAMRRRSATGSSVWESWDNLGLGLLTLLPKYSPVAITPTAPSQPVIFWLDGDSRMTRSLHVALQRTESQPQHFFWSDASSTSNVKGQAEEQLQDQQATATSRPTRVSVIDSICSLMENSEAACKLVLVGNDLTATCELLGKLPSDALAGLWLTSNVPLVNGRVRNVCNIDQVVVLSASEIQVAAEAYDFRRWTDRDVDLDLLRDAYDEYVDF